MEIRVREFNVKNANGNEWDRYHIFRKEYHDENVPDDPFVKNQEYEKIRKPEFEDKEFIKKFFILEIQDKIIGSMENTFFSENSSSHQGNENLLLYDCRLLKSFRRKGIGSKLLEEIAKIAQSNHKTVLITFAREEDGKKFLNTINSKVVLTYRENRLYIKDINWELIRSWIKEGEKLNPETKIMSFNYVPDDLLENYCKTLTFAINQQPRGNLALGDRVTTPENYRKREEAGKKAGRLREIVVTLEKDKTISGLTVLTKIGSNENVLDQGLTGVLIEFRGRKLGKWIKAQQLVNIRSKYPNLEYIITGNAEINAPMLSINNRLGFKKYSEGITSQITLDELNKYIQSRNKDYLVEILF